MPYTEKTYRNESLCWTCQNAVPDQTHGCNWSRDKKPVEGWDADKTFLNHQTCGDSYRVKGCPEYKKDEPQETEGKKKLLQELAERVVQEARRPRLAPGDHTEYMDRWW